MRETSIDIDIDIDIQLQLGWLPVAVHIYTQYIEYHN
jgi:hypothetical protein